MNGAGMELLSGVVEFFDFSDMEAKSFLSKEEFLSLFSPLESYRTDKENYCDCLSIFTDSINENNDEPRLLTSVKGMDRNYCSRVDEKECYCHQICRSLAIRSDSARRVYCFLENSNSFQIGDKVLFSFFYDNFSGFMFAENIELL